MRGEDIVVAVKAQIRGATTSRELIAALNDCEAGLKAAFPQVRWVFFEPVLATKTSERARQ